MTAEDYLSNDDTVEVDKEALRTLRDFAVSHSGEYGTVFTDHAIIDAGVALGKDDPTPPEWAGRYDTEAQREYYGDEIVDTLQEKYERHGDDQ